MRLVVLAAVLTLLVFPAAAGAKEPLPWATVNVCDTVKQPDRLGIRASMPGTPKGARLSMRFRVQYRSGEDWKDVEDADSGWVKVGVAKGNPVEYGWSFTFASSSRESTLRGVVKFRWRRGSMFPKTSEVATEAGHRSSAGADPAGYSGRRPARSGKGPPKHSDTPMAGIRGAPRHPRCSRGRATHRYRVRPGASTAASPRPDRPCSGEPC